MEFEYNLIMHRSKRPERRTSAELKCPAIDLALTYTQEQSTVENIMTMNSPIKAINRSITEPVAPLQYDPPHELRKLSLIFSIILLVLCFTPTHRSSQQVHVEFCLLAYTTRAVMGTQ